MIVFEVVGGCWLDRKLWGGLYTPYFFLSVPYLAVVLFTILVAGRFGLVPFYYPSLLPWIAGLPLFLLASLAFYLISRKLKPYPGRLQGKALFAEVQSTLRWKVWVACLIFVILAARLVVLLCDEDLRCPVGTECFGAMFASYGLWGHLSVIAMALMLFCVVFFENPLKDTQWMQSDQNRWLWISFLLLLLLALVHQVKSWIILPIAAGLLGRLVSGRKFRWRYLIWALIGGTAVFFLSYIVIYLAGDSMFSDTTFGGQVGEIFGLFVHYVTSGTLGLSLDMQQGVLETPDPHYVLAPFYNIWHILSGQEVVTGYSQDFLHTGLNYTNVRTFFGTIFVYMGREGLAWLSFLFGLVCYGMFWLWKRYGGVVPLCIYAWVAVILCMGWFNLYTQLLTTWEVPFWILVSGLADRFLVKRTSTFSRSMN